MHHAHLIIADRESGIAHARALFARSENAHPDLHILIYDTFGIDEARMIEGWAHQKPVAAPYRAFIIACDRITLETQNALLKLFEEPPATSVFSLVIHDAEVILPTLRSRFALVRIAAAVDGAVAAAFLAMPYAARLEEINARTKAKDVAWQSALVGGLERHFHAKGEWQMLKEITEVVRMIGARGASPKMLLEHVALSVPVL